MLPLTQFLASFCAAIFAGAAVYITIAEHPARMRLDTAAALAQWAPSYERATLMQAPLALIGFVSGVTAWLLGAGRWWLVASCLIGAVIPFTLVVIMPTNHRLQAHDLDPGSAETRALLERWGRLHAVRSALGIAAAALFLWQACA